jgi:hypothetical protein
MLMYCVFSIHRESPGMILGDKPLIYKVVLSQYRLHTGVYGPSKLMYLVVNRYLTFITALMAVLGEKLGDGHVDHSSKLGIVSGALFLRSSRVHPTFLMAFERLTHTGTAVGSVRGIYVDWREKHTCHVDRVFSYRVYIDSNRRDSQI